MPRGAAERTEAPCVRRQRRPDERAAAPDERRAERRAEAAAHAVHGRTSAVFRIRGAYGSHVAHCATLRCVYQPVGADGTRWIAARDLQMTQVLSPIEMPLRLGRERRERYVTLSAMKDTKLQVSRAFLRRRCGALDVRKPYSEDLRFETATGDYCAVRFSVLQFEGVHSVQQVYDVLRFQFCNIEISISEKLGNITIRENDDTGDDAFTQHRLVGSTARNVLLESNTVMFAEFREQDEQQGGGAYALISAEFVDDDALYPYRPDQRVRRDVSAILQLTSFTRLVVNAFGAPEEQLVVVLTRWTHSRLHRPAFRVSDPAMHELRENTERWGESMHRIMRETLYPDA